MIFVFKIIGQCLAILKTLTIKVEGAPTLIQILLETLMIMITMEKIFLISKIQSFFLITLNLLLPIFPPLPNRPLFPSHSLFSFFLILCSSLIHFSPSRTLSSPFTFLSDFHFIHLRFSSIPTLSFPNILPHSIVPPIHFRSLFTPLNF